MQETLVIYIHAEAAERPSWAVLAADGSVRQHAYHDSAEGLAQIAAEKNIVVIVPAEDVLLTAVRMPKMNRSRLLQALPYALEEQLISDVENLHFAIGVYQPDTDLAVAIVAQAKMQQWQLLLQAWGVPAEIMIPLTFALPFSEDAWHVLIQDMAVLRMQALQGAACDIQNFPAFLAAALASVTVKPARIAIRNYSEHVVAEAVQVAPEDFIVDVARQALKTPYINLLQGHYAVKKSRLPPMDNLTRTVRMLSKLVLILLFFYPFGSLLILNHRAKTIDDNIAVIYKRNFSQATNVIAPKLRMQDKLNKLEAQIGENRVLLLLGYVGKALTETGGINLKRLDFQNNQLTLELTAATSMDFSAFTDFLSGKGLKLKQQNATLSGEHVNATVQVE